MVPHTNQFSDTNQVSVLTLSTWSLHLIPQVRGSVSQGPPHFRCQSQVQVVTSTSDQPVINPSPLNPFLGFDNLLEWLRETHLLIYYTRIQLRNTQMEEIHRARYGGRGKELPCSLQVGHFPVPCSHHPRSSSNPIVLWRLHHLGMIFCPLPLP